MELKFFSIEEVKDFVKSLKGTRAKGDATGDEGNAPPPLAPPTGTQGFAGAMIGGPQFAPPVGGAGPAAGAFPAPGALQVAPEVLALVQRINIRMDGALASGQPAQTMHDWFKGQLVAYGIDATSYTLDQIKAQALPKLPFAALESIAKLMAA